jgi:hypothetical protein
MPNRRPVDRDPKWVTDTHVEAYKRSDAELQQVKKKLARTEERNAALRSKLERIREIADKEMELPPPPLFGLADRLEKALHGLAQIRHVSDPNR